MKKTASTIGILLLILLICLLGAGVFFVGQDEPPPFTGDVELAFSPPAKDSFQERLGRGDLQVPRELLRQADDLESKANKTNQYKNAQEAHKIWDAEKMDEVLTGIPPEIWANVDNLLHAPTDRIWDTGHSVLSTINSVRVIKYKALRLAQQGKADEGLRLAGKIALLGTRYCESGCSIIDLLGGLSIRSTGYTTMGEIIGNYRVSPQCLREMREYIRQSHVSNDTVRDNIKAEYSCMRRQFLDPGLSDINQLNNMMGKGSSFTGHFLSIPYASNLCPHALLIKPNETLRIYTEWNRATLAWPYLDAKELHKITFDLEQEALKYEKGRFPYDPYNAGGRAMISIIVVGCQSALHRRLVVESAVSSLDALMAVREYELQHGTLPNSLDILVPDYLPAVPMDFADGAPIRYSPQSRAIWSIGRKCDLVEPLPKPEYQDDREGLIFRLLPLTKNEPFEENGNKSSATTEEKSH